MYLFPLLICALGHFADSPNEVTKLNSYSFLFLFLFFINALDFCLSNLGFFFFSFNMV